MDMKIAQLMMEPHQVIIEFMHTGTESHVSLTGMGICGTRRDLPKKRKMRRKKVSVSTLWQ